MSELSRGNLAPFLMIKFAIINITTLVAFFNASIMLSELVDAE